MESTTQAPERRTSARRPSTQPRCARPSRPPPRPTPTASPCARRATSSPAPGASTRSGCARWRPASPRSASGKGDTVALMLTNRPEFHFADAAAMHLGATCFSIYNTYTPEQIEYLVGDAGNTRRRHRAGLPRPAAGRSTALEHVVVVDGDAPDGRDDARRTLEGRGDEDFDFEAAWRAVEPEDILTLIYTSGTTGPPKGVQITHANLAETVRSYDDIIAFPDGGRVVSYLPMAHVAERNVSHYLPMMLGFTVTCCPDPRQVIAYMPEVQAHLVLRRAADLGEAQGRARGDARGARGRAAEGGDQGRPRRRPAPREADPGRRGGARGARAASGRRPTARCSRASARCSASTRSRPATSAPRRRRPR